MRPSAAVGSLFELLKERRGQLIARWGERIRSSIATASMTHGELLDHMPAFVDDIIRALYPDAMPLPPLVASAEEHGGQRLRLGFDVAQVVREYGALHDCILEIATEAGYLVSARDQTVIAKWLNAGIANAVTQYVSDRDVELERQASEHLGFIAHELRGPLGAAQLAFHRLGLEASKQGRAVDILDRNLRRTGEIIDSVLKHAWLKMGVVPHLAPVGLAELLRDIEADTAIEAQGKSLAMTVSAPSDLVVEADARLLRSAISNLVHNAMKFSHPNATVTLTAQREDGRVAIEVADGCGGLPPGRAEELFAPTVQRSENRSGFGLGLAIALQAAEAHNGTIKVRDVPGTGCVFVIDLPVARV